MRAIDLFAGIGGMRLGFEQAIPGMETVFASEIDKFANQTYLENFGGTVAGDITKIDAADIPPSDLYLAGFPCQAFSLAGHRLGFEDTRGTLFFDVARICAHHRPRAIVCENVKGLLNHDKGNTMRTILGALEDLGYSTYHKVLNSKDFGVPQHRERVYIVALSEGDFEFPEPPCTPTCVGDILEDSVDPKYTISEKYMDFLKRHRADHEARGGGFGYVVRERESIAGAVVCGGMGRERNLVRDGDDIRRMTPREMARLQGFPDTFRFPVSDTQAYKQLGNSVTVPVVRAIAEGIRW